MKIVFFSVANVPSKIAESVFTMKLSEALVNNGHDVLLLAQGLEQADDTLDTAHQYYGVQPTFLIRRLPSLIALPGRRFINAAIGAFWARRWGASIAYGRNVHACFWAVVFGLPTLLELHTPMKDRGKAADMIFRKLIGHRRFKRLVVITHSLKQYYTQEYGIPSDKILVAPDAASEPSSNDSLTLDQDRLQVGYTGQLYPGKGAEIISALAHRLPWADFHCVGGFDDDIQYWRKETADISNVFFHGHIPYKELDRYRTSFDVMLAPYLNEVHGFDGATGSNLANWMSPMKIFEYMAAGKPIVASDLPVIREVLTHKQDSILCDPDKVDEWEAGLVLLQQDTAFRERIANCAYEKFLKNYNWDARAEKILASL